MAVECQAESGIEFPERRSCAKKLMRRRVLGRPAKASVAVAGAGRIVIGQPFLYRWVVEVCHGLPSFDTLCTARCGRRHAPAAAISKKALDIEAAVDFNSPLEFDSDTLGS
jgi:hypothetical protein